jgi:hypothetical protein
VLRRLRAHFRQQLVAYLALFVALGGTTYAAATIGASNIKNDAVRSRHIKDGQVKNADLGTNSVGTGKVIDGSLLKQDFKAGEVPASSHYVTFDLVQPIEKKTILNKGPLRLEAECSKGTTERELIVSLHDSSAVPDANVTTSADTQGPAGFGRTGTRVGSDGNALIAGTNDRAGFYWYGGVPISAISKSTTLDGVLSYGVNGYHDCMVSFFGG